jgi:hypothetical protein
MAVAVSKAVTGLSLVYETTLDPTSETEERTLSVAVLNALRAWLPADCN